MSPFELLEITIGSCPDVLRDGDGTRAAPAADYG
jgi:hypothetical protein